MKLNSRNLVRWDYPSPHADMKTSSSGGSPLEERHLRHHTASRCSRILYECYFRGPPLVLPAFAQDCGVVHQQWQLWLVGMCQSSGDINQSPLSPWGNNKYGQSSHKHIWVTWSDPFALNLPSCNGSLHHFHSTQQVNETHMLDESVGEMEK